MKKRTNPVRFFAIFLLLLFIGGTAHFAARGQTKTKVKTPTYGKVTGITRAPTAHKPYHPTRRNLKGRIRAGRRDGSLTRGESRALRGEVRDIKSARREARADGVVTRNERRLKRQLRRNASGDIYAARHNDQKRGLRKKTKQ